MINAIIRRIDKFLAPPSPAVTARAGARPPPASSLLVAPVSGSLPAAQMLPNAIERTLGQPLPDLGDRRYALPAVEPESLLASQDERIRATWYAAGLNEAEFDLVMKEVYLRFAAYVQMLPASEADHHCGHAGLFQHSCEVAFGATRLAENQVYAMDREPLVRKMLEPRWRIATALAGLLHDIGKAVVDIEVTDEKGEQRWDAFAGSLLDWMHASGTTRYIFHWMPGRTSYTHTEFAVGAAHIILGSKFLAWLGEHNQGEIAQAMFAAIGGSNASNNPIADAVRKADGNSAVQERNRMRQAMAVAGKNLQANLSSNLARMIRDTVKCGTWKINNTHQPVFNTTLGLLLLHPLALQRAANLLIAEGQSSVPTDQIRLVELMHDAGLISNPPNGSQNPVFKAMVVTPEDTFSAQFLLLAEANVLFAGIVMPPPFVATIVNDSSVQMIPSPKLKSPKDDQLDLFATPPAPQPIGVTAAAATAPGDSPAKATSNTVATAPTASSGEISEPEIVDRRERTDSMDDRRRAIWNEQRSQADPVPETAALARAWFEAQGRPGEMLLGVLDRIGQQIQWVRDVDLVDEHLAFRFPEAFEGVAGFDPKKLMEAFRDARWIQLHPDVPSRPTQMLAIGGKNTNALAFNERISATALVYAPVGKRPPARSEESPTRPSASAQASASTKPTASKSPRTEADPESKAAAQAAAAAALVAGATEPKTPRRLPRVLKQHVAKGLLAEFGSLAQAPKGDALRQRIAALLESKMTLPEAYPLLLHKPDPLIRAAPRLAETDPDLAVISTYRVDP